MTFIPATLPNALTVTTFCDVSRSVSGSAQLICRCLLLMPLAFVHADFFRFIHGIFFFFFFFALLCFFIVRPFNAQPGKPVNE